jgi:hypothetical protein
MERRAPGHEFGRWACAWRIAVALGMAILLLLAIFVATVDMEAAVRLWALALAAPLAPIGATVAVEYWRPAPWRAAFVAACVSVACWWSLWSLGAIAPATAIGAPIAEFFPNPQLVIGPATFIAAADAFLAFVAVRAIGRRRGWVPVPFPLVRRTIETFQILSSGARVSLESARPGARLMRLETVLWRIGWRLAVTAAVVTVAVGTMFAIAIAAWHEPINPIDYLAIFLAPPLATIAVEYRRPNAIRAALIAPVMSVFVTPIWLFMYGRFTDFDVHWNAGARIESYMILIASLAAVSGLPAWVVVKSIELTSGSAERIQSERRV